MVAQDQAQLEIDPKEVTRLFRAWGWKYEGNNRWSESWKKNNKKISITRKKGGVHYDQLKDAAQMDGVTVDRWLDGPPEGYNPNPHHITQDDIDWWLKQSFSRLEHPDDKIRYRRIREHLQKEGTLDDWNKVKDKRRAGLEQPRLPVEVPSPSRNGTSTEVAVPEPSTRPDNAITLTQALALTGRKKNQLGATAAKIITVLAHHGPVKDKNGRATARLMGKMVDPPGSTGAISGPVKEMIDIGLIKVERRGKRTFEIALGKPVWVSPGEVSEYVRTPKKPKMPALEPTPDENSVENSTEDSVEQPPPATTPPVGADMGSAIAVLKAKLAEFDRQIEALQNQREGLIQAIELIGGHDGPHPEAG